MEHMLNQKAAYRARTDGFVTLETIAIMVVVVLVIIVTIAILFTPQFSQDSTLKAPVDTLPSSVRDPLVEQQDIRYVDPSSPFAQADKISPEGKSFNERVYDDNKIAFANSKEKVQGTRFKGEILSIDRSEGISLRMKSLLENSIGVEVLYVLDTTTLSKITVKNGSLDSLAPKQKINIDETNDYAKPYPESIQSIEISTIE